MRLPTVHGRWLGERDGLSVTRGAADGVEQGIACRELLPSGDLWIRHNTRTVERRPDPLLQWRASLEGLYPTIAIEQMKSCIRRVC